MKVRCPPDMPATRCCISFPLTRNSPLGDVCGSRWPGEMELGLPVTQEQVDELEAHITDIDYEKAAQWERKLRHDVMAHVHTYGELCPKAMPIIHLGPPAAMWGTIPT